MNSPRKPVVLATRGSALALAQAHQVAAACRAAFPRLKFELKIIKTTGDKSQTASLAGGSGAAGLFTKELEVALLRNRADLAVHSLKDLPVDVPGGLALGAVLKRADARDILVYRDAEFLARERKRIEVEEWTPGQAERRGLKRGARLKDLPSGAAVGTSSTRRRAQLLDRRPDLRIEEIRGNVPTRLERFASRAGLDAIVLAAAGFARLDFRVFPDGQLRGDAVPDGLLAVHLEPEEMMPCVGQGAIGIEIRAGDGEAAAICERLNHFNSLRCVECERAFLRALGGGCRSPVGAYAEILGHQIRLRAVVYDDGPPRRVEGRRPLQEGIQLAEELAGQVRPRPAPAEAPQAQ